MSLTNFVWLNRKAVVTLVVLLCFVGSYCALHLPVAIFPQLVVPRIAVETEAGDIPILTTLARVTRPLEAAVSTVPGVTRVFSTTTRGSDTLDVTFADGSDMQLALQRVQAQIAEARAGALPAGADVRAAVLNPSIFPIMGYSLTSTSMDLVSLRQLALYTIRPRLARLPGVAQIRITGGDTLEYLVSARPGALAQHGLSLQNLIDAIASANGVTSVGHADRSYQRYEILVSGLLHDEADIGAVVVAVHNGVPIQVSDVADIRQSVAPRTILATGNGQDGVILNVIKQPEANTVQVAGEVRAALADMLGDLPVGLHTSLFYDQSEIVAQSESSVVESILVGGALALVVLVLFLGNARVATVVLIQLPLTLLIEFGLMRALGQTLNIMTLGAMAISLGMVIDDGIVVVENIYHELERGLSRMDAVVAGMHSIGSALLGSSLTTVVTFLPLTLLGGVTGQFFAPLSLVMISTLLVSLALALCITPLVATVVLPAKVDAGNGGSSKRIGLSQVFPRLFERIASGFGVVLLACLRHRLAVILATVAAIAVGGIIYGRLATGFFPEFDEGAFVIDYIMPAGTSLAETDRVAHQIEAGLRDTPEVASWSRLTGALSGSGLELAEQNQGDILVRLRAERHRSSDAICDDLRDQIQAQNPALQVDFAQILQDGIGDIAGSPSPIEVKIFGPDTTKLIQLAHQVGGIITRIPGVVDENDGVVDSDPEVIVKVDGQRAARSGLTTSAVTTAAEASIAGDVATTIQQTESGVDVRVTAQGDGRDLDTLPDLLIDTPLGAPVPLRSLATLDSVAGTPQITREDQQQMISVTARLEGVDLGAGVGRVQTALSHSVKLPTGYRLEYGGLYASQQQSFAQLGGVMLITILLVATMLLAILRSFRQALSLFAAAVLSLSGVVAALYLTGTPLNISSFTGAIMVIGIVTEDGIVFFDVVNHLRKLNPEQTLTDIVLESRRLRLRPILMTILAAILALYPMALGIGAGAAMQRPLAIAVIGGLAASTWFTLIVAPVLFVAMAGRPRQS